MTPDIERRILAVLQQLNPTVHPSTAYLAAVGGVFANEMANAIEKYPAPLADDPIIQSQVTGCIVVAFMALGARHALWAERLAADMASIPDSVVDSLYGLLHPVPLRVWDAMAVWDKEHGGIDV